MLYLEYFDCFALPLDNPFQRGTEAFYIHLRSLQSHQTPQRKTVILPRGTRESLVCCCLRSVSLCYFVTFKGLVWIH